MEVQGMPLVRTVVSRAGPAAWATTVMLGVGRVHCCSVYTCAMELRQEPEGGRGEPVSRPAQREGVAAEAEAVSG